MSQSMNGPAGKFKLKVVKIKYLVNIQFSYFPDFQWRFTGLETFFFKFMTSRIRWISGNLWLLNISFFPSHSWCLIKSIKLSPPLTNFFFHISRTTKVFDFKFWLKAWNLSESLCAKFQGHMTSTGDVITCIWEASPQKMAILACFFIFSNAFDIDTDDKTIQLCVTLNNTSN